MTECFIHNSNTKQSTIIIHFLSFITLIERKNKTKQNLFSCNVN